MAGPILIRNAVDTFTSAQSGQTKKNYANTAGLRLRTGGAGTQYGWIYFALPFPRGANIQSAKLRLYVSSGFAGRVVTVQRTNAKWSVNKITDAAKPGVTGTAGVSASINGPYGTEILIDVTTMMQEIAAGAAWYGMRISAAGTADGVIVSANNSSTARRPTLELTWTDAPEPPDTMSPSGGRAVTMDKPILTFDYTDPSSDSPLSAVDIEIDPAANWTAPAWKSATANPTGIPATIPQVDLTTTTYPGLALNGTTYWRVRVKDSGGLWSDWSHTVNGTGNQFKRIAKGTVTLNNPAASPNNFIWETTPVIDWSVAGLTQKHYQVLIVDGVNTASVYWNSGKITSTVTNVTVPSGKIKTSGAAYRVILRIWDTIDRIANGSDPAYTEVVRDFTYNYDNTVPPVTSLAAATNPNVPGVDLTWQRASMPDFWQVMRDGEFIGDQIPGPDLFVSGTSYKVTDLTSTHREQHTYKVLAITNSRQSDVNPTVDITPTIAFPWLMMQDGTAAIALLNPEKTLVYLQSQELHPSVGNYPPAVITQNIGGYSGTVRGLLTDDVIPGVTARTMRDRLRSMRKQPGIKLILKMIDETMVVAIYNVQIQAVSTPSAVSYVAQFDYVQLEY